jgi:hypothetical protein
VCIRTPRKGNAPHSTRWPDASIPLNVEAEGDLMLLHLDGSEECQAGEVRNNGGGCHAHGQ